MDVSVPFAYEKATTPKIIIMLQKIISILVVPEISPYPTVVKVVHVQYMEVIYKLPVSLSLASIESTHVSLNSSSYKVATMTHKQETICTTTILISMKKKSLSNPRPTFKSLLRYFINLFLSFTSFKILRSLVSLTNL